MKSGNGNEHLGTVSLYLDSDTLHNVGGVLYFVHRAVTMFKGKPSFPNHFWPVELRFGCFGKRLPRFFIISQVPGRCNQTQKETGTVPRRTRAHLCTGATGCTNSCSTSQRRPILLSPRRSVRARYAVEMLSTGSSRMWVYLTSLKRKRSRRKRESPPLAAGPVNWSAVARSDVTLTRSYRLDSIV
jgi:hypothetical protein